MLARLHVVLQQLAFQLCPLPPSWPDPPLVPLLPPEPNFVAAYDIGLFAYFLLRENAVEHDCGRTVYSRVARVCKNDMGGRFLLEDTWTTFMKARLNCSRPGEVPFYYNELQSEIGRASCRERVSSPV